MEAEETVQIYLSLVAYTGGQWGPKDCADYFEIIKKELAKCGEPTKVGMKLVKEPSPTH
jgi:hypothetical protein